MKTNEIIAIKPQKLLRRKELNSPIVQWVVLLQVLILLRAVVPCCLERPVLACSSGG